MKCSVCLGNVRWNQTTVECLCGRLCHETCCNLNLDPFSNLWTCSTCILNELPFNHILDDHEFQSALFSFFNYTSNGNTRNLDSYVFDAFNMNEECAIDNDLENPCQYYFNDTFNRNFLLESDNTEFSIFHLNSQSLSAKYLDISDYISTLQHKFSIYAFTETWFKPMVSSLYNMSGYSFIHKSRDTRRGGGVCMYIDSKLSYQERDDLTFSNDSIDTLFVEISRKGQKNIIVGVVYKPPNFDSDIFNGMLEKCVSAIAKEKKDCYIVGDFNFDILKYSSHLATNEFLSTMYTNGLRPLITKPTRVTHSSHTCIDNIFTNVVDNPIVPGILFSDISDHLPIFNLTKSLHTLDSHCSKKTSASSLKNINFTDLSHDLYNVNWSLVNRSDDPNDAYDTFIEIVTPLCNKHTEKSKPIKKDKKYVPRKPWITQGIMMSIATKQKLYHKFIHVPSKINEKKYKGFRNKLNRIIRLRKQDYFTFLIEQNKNDICKTWKIVNEIMGRQNISRLPQFIQKQHRRLYDDREIADDFNSYFSSIGSSISEKIKHSTKPFTHYLNSRTRKSIFFLPTNENEIIDIVKQMKNSSSCGHDGISVKFIKNIIHAVAKPLSVIYNLSISTGIVPDSFKVAKVIPVYKKDNKNQVENYRPISLLLTFSKILEKIIYKRLYNHLNDNDILVKEQFGFRPSYSTETALLHTLEQIITSLDNKQITMAIYIDLSKAFDSLDHNILLHKLEHYGIRGIPYNWFKNYLTGRKQFTQFNDVSSDILPITCGVPQGSTLGPLLFLIYANDIINTSKLLRFVLYADDTNILFTHKDEKALYNTVNNELTNVCDWFMANRLQINRDKTKYMIFRSSNQYNNLNLNVHIDDITIDKISKINFLGVIIDDRLTWTDHVNSIRGKISMSIGIMRKLRSILPLKTLFMLYNAFVLPYLDYCSLVWSGTSSGNLQRLYTLQKKAIRICTNSHFIAHTSPLFKELNCVTFYDSISLKLGIFMFKFVNGLLPDIFIQYFKRNLAIHQFNTRNKNNFVLPFCRLTLKQNNSVIYKGSKLWNELDSTLKNVNMTSSFRSKFKKHIVNAY